MILLHCRKPREHVSHHQHTLVGVFMDVLSQNTDICHLFACGAKNVFPQMTTDANIRQVNMPKGLTHFSHSETSVPNGNCDLWLTLMCLHINQKLIHFDQDFDAKVAKSLLNPMYLSKQSALLFMSLAVHLCTLTFQHSSHTIKIG